MFDAGVYYRPRPKGPLDSPDEIHGMALEGLVLQHLKAWCDYSDKQVDGYFWRTQGGSEVDFVVYGPNHFHALEVKSAQQIQPSRLRPLKTFLKDYPRAKAMLLYRGTEKLGWMESCVGWLRIVCGNWRRTDGLGLSDNNRICRGAVSHNLTG